MSKGQRKGKRQPKPRPKQVVQTAPERTPHPVRTGLKVLGALVAVAMIIYVAAVWSSVPDQVPINFDADNNPIEFGAKGYLMACPILGAILWVMVAIAANDNRIWRLPFRVRAEAGKQVNAIMNNVMVLLSVELELIFLILSISMAASWNPGSIVLFGGLVAAVATVVIGGWMCYQIGGLKNGGGSAGGNDPFSAPPNSLGRRL